MPHLFLCEPVAKMHLLALNSRHREDACCLQRINESIVACFADEFTDSAESDVDRRRGKASSHHLRSVGHHKRAADRLASWLGKSE